MTLTVRDAGGHVVRTFSSADQPEKLPVRSTSRTGGSGEAPRVSDGRRMHRFVWDLRYPRPDALSYDYSIAGVWHEGTPIDPRGPLALPGRYSVSLAVERQDVHAAAHRAHGSARARGRRALRAQLALASRWTPRWAAPRGATGRDRNRDGHKGSLSPAATDSANAIAGGLATVDGVFASLATQVVEADAAPTKASAACSRMLAADSTTCWRAGRDSNPLIHAEGLNGAPLAGRRRRRR